MWSPTDCKSCKMVKKITANSISRRKFTLAGAIFVLCLAALGSQLYAEDLPGMDPNGTPLIEVGEVVVDSVFCPYDMVFLGQISIPVSFSVLNGSDANILIQFANPIFTAVLPGDRNKDYEVTGELNPNLIMLPGTEYTFEYTVNVLPSALLDTEIRLDGYIFGRRLSNFEAVNDTTADRPHRWTVASNGINTVAALFDTRLTSERSDDSLICLIDEENFQLDTTHYLNKGSPLGELRLDGQTIYRLVLQISPFENWEWDPKESEKGFMKIGGMDTGFGMLSGQRAGLKELLVSDLFIPDYKTNTIDFVRGATRGIFPPLPWNMMTDPWTDPIVDYGKTDEVGSLLESLTNGYIIDCIDDDEHWEVTVKCESDRYYFYETWFQPDLEWNSGELVDISLTLLGASGESDMDALHLFLRTVDDDSIPPLFSDFAPEIVPASVAFDIACRISDPSGVYDDDTGYGGQGVYLLWDDDGSLLDDFNELQMSHVGDGIFRTDSPIGSRNEGDVIVYEVFACDDDTDDGNIIDRNCGNSVVKTVQIVSGVYLEEEPGSLYPRRVYAGESGISIHVDFANTTIYDIELDTNSILFFSDSIYDVTARLANTTLIPPGAANFPVAFEPIDIPEEFAAPETCLVRFDLQGRYDNGGEVFHQSWIASSSNIINVLEPTLRFIPHSLPSLPVHPGDELVELLRFEVISEAPAGITLDSMVVSNMGTGPTSVRDLNTNRIYLYRQSSSLLGARPTLERTAVDQIEEDGPSLETNPRDALTRPISEGDSLVATSRFESGNATFRLTSGKVIAPWESVFFYVVADIDSFLACDGDELDAAITAKDSVFVTGYAMVTFETSPLNSEGSTPLDGFMPFQMNAEASLPDTIFTTDADQPVLAIVIPVNGYSPDILMAVSLKSYGDEEIVDLVESLRLWLDDGDGTFSSGSDSLLGELVATGDCYEISGISFPVTERKRLIATADFEQGDVSALTILFGVPEGGIGFISDNDGPIGEDVLSPKEQLLIRREIITLDALPLPPSDVRPGTSDVAVLALRFGNNMLGSFTLDSLGASCDSIDYVCEPSKAFALYLDDGDEIYDPSTDTFLSSTALVSWHAMFNGIDLEVGSGEEIDLFVCTDIDSFHSIDGSSLSTWIESPADLHLTLGAMVVSEFYLFEADFPIESDGGPVVDGMLAHQVDVIEHGDTTIVGQLDDILMLELSVPGNGCIDDTLTAVSVFNGGTAGAEHIDRLVLWVDDGDALFEPVEDDQIAVFTADLYVPSVYTASGFSVHVEGMAGIRLYVSFDLAESIESGATIMPGIPVMGLKMASGNDGPIDREIISESTLIIPVPDRVTFYASVIGNRRVRPGEKDILNMVLGAYNSYSEEKRLESLILINVGTVDSLELTEVVAYEDTDGNGLFNPLIDRLAARGSLREAGYIFGYSFEELGIILKPHKSTLVFLGYGTELHDLRDSVKVDFQVSNELSMEFSDDQVNVQGDFPLNSPGIDVTDGMIRAQIGLLEMHGSRVSPGDEDVPCFTFTVPCNGTEEDVLRNVAIVNSGTAVQGDDVEYVKLWVESGGDAASFDPGEERFLDFLAWNGSAWKSFSQLVEAIPCGGLTLHVTTDFTESATNGRTLRVTLPTNGIQVASGNDGPIDQAMTSTALVSVTTDALIASLEVPRYVTVGDEFETMMRVSNVADTSLSQVEPDSFAYWGTGALTPTSGPEPMSIGTLPGGGDSVFVWGFRADDTGWAIFRGKALEVAGNEASLLESSDTLFIQAVPNGLRGSMSDLTPVSLNRGQIDVHVLEVTLDYDPPSPQSAPVEFRGLRIMCTDGSNSPVPFKNVTSRVCLEDEIMILASIETEVLSDSSVVLLPAEPMVFAPGESHTFRVSLDISETAQEDNFKIRINDASSIEVVDRNNGNPVDVEDISLPWSTNTVQLNDPALALLVGFADVLPDRINKGQEDVEGFEIVFKNDGGASAADIIVSEIVFRIFDEGGDSTDAGGIFRSVSIKDGFDYTYCWEETFSTSSYICLDLQPSVTVSPQIPVTLKLVADFLNNPIPGGFSIMLEDSLDITARDDNSGNMIAVLADTASTVVFPMTTGTAYFNEPLESVLVSGLSLLQGSVVAGQQDIQAMQAIIAHPGEAGESSVRFDEMTFRVLDELGHRIPPVDLIELVRLVNGQENVAVISLTPADSMSVTLRPLSGLVIDPGESDTLILSFDLDAGTEPGYFQIHVDRQEISLVDATDGTDVENVVGEFPLTSGLGNIVMPAGDLAFAALGTMPGNVTSGEEVQAFRLDFDRSDETGGSTALVHSIDFILCDGRERTIDPMAAIDAIRMLSDSGDIPSDVRFDAGYVRLEFTEPLAVTDGESCELRVLIMVSASPAVGLFSIHVEELSHISCTDGTTGNPISVYPQGGGSFPFSSGRAAILSSRIEESFTNYPNPFVPSEEPTRITFYMPGDGTVTLKIYTMTGRPVATLLDNSTREAGLHQDVTWDGRNGKGTLVINGVYYLVLETRIGGNGKTIKRKVAVIR